MGLNSRIWLSRSQAVLIQAGLECLVNRLAGASAGCFPFRNTWDRIDLQASDIYREKKFSDTFAAMILSLRDRFRELGGAGKISLNVIELAAASFATRIGGMDPQHKKEPKMDAKLARKIEMHRKRAKRAAIGRVGHAHYEERSVEWRKFVQWARYYLLSRYTRRPSLGALRRVWRQQYEEFLQMAEAVVSECQYLVNAPDELPRIVRLALAELRRRRHPFTIRGLCANEEQGKAFLFEFALARKVIRRIHEDVPLCILQSERGDKFRAALENSSEIGIMPASTVAIDVSKPQGVGVQRGTFPSPRVMSVPMVVKQGMPPVKRAKPSPVMLCAETIGDEQIADAVAQWFQAEIDPGLREQIRTEAQFQVTKYPMRDIDRISFATLSELVAKTRGPEIPVDVIDMLNFGVDWLLRWLLVLRRDPCRIHRIVGVGYARAMKAHGLSAA